MRWEAAGGSGRVWSPVIRAGCFFPQVCSALVQKSPLQARGGEDPGIFHSEWPPPPVGPAGVSSDLR